MSDGILDFITQQNRASALRDYAAQAFGANSPQAALATGNPDVFANFLGTVAQKQQEEGAIKQFYGTDKPNANAQPLPADSTSGDLASQALASIAVPAPTALQRMAGSMANLPPSLQPVAAQQIMMQNPNSDGTGAGSNLTGEDFLKTLNRAYATQVRAYATGNLPIPARLQSSPAFQPMMQAISQYDPTFDATNYQARAATRKSFTSGPDAANITALNTALPHLATLKDSYDALGNGAMPMVNAAKNAIGSELGNSWLGRTLGLDKVQGNVSAVGTDAHAVSEELAKVFRSTGMAESDVQAWEKKLTDSASPDQQKAILGQAVDLLDGRLQALGDKYNQGMGTTKQGLELLNPKAQAAYSKVSGRPVPAGNTVGAQAPALSQMAASPDGTVLAPAPVQGSALQAVAGQGDSLLSPQPPATPNMQNSDPRASQRKDAIRAQLKARGLLK